MATPRPMYTVCYKPLFVFGTFEHISLLGFQWADAVQLLKQYLRCGLTRLCRRLILQALSLVHCEVEFKRVFSPVWFLLPFPDLCLISDDALRTCYLRHGLGLESDSGTQTEVLISSN